MAILEITKAGAPVLTEVCSPVEKIEKGLRKLLDDMALDGEGAAPVAADKSVAVKPAAPAVAVSTEAAQKAVPDHGSHDDSDAKKDAKKAQ